MNVIDFKSRDDNNQFEDLSLSERQIMIESWNSDMAQHLDEIRKHAAELEALLKAREAFDF